MPRSRLRVLTHVTILVHHGDERFLLPLCVTNAVPPSRFATRPRARQVSLALPALVQTTLLRLVHWAINVVAVQYLDVYDNFVGRPTLSWCDVPAPKERLQRLQRDHEACRFCSTHHPFGVGAE